MITVGTDCSGIEAPLEALRQMKIPFIQKWSCEIDKYARMTAEANYPKPEKIYKNMLTRNNNELPHVDLYVCGFPCQAFSNMGNRLGTKDPRAKIIPKMVDTIKNSRPKVCILENVRGFINIENGSPMENLVQSLEKLEYSVNYSLYNTKNYGLPQNRERVYFVCIRKDLQKKQYIKPKECKMKPFERILINTTIQPGEIPKMYIKNNVVKNKKDFHIINNNYNKLQIMKNISPTLTTSSRYYILELNRTLLPKEALILQGFDSELKQLVSNNQFIKQIGNSMSVNVLKCILKEVFRCI